MIDDDVQFPDNQLGDPELMLHPTNVDFVLGLHANEEQERNETSGEEKAPEETDEKGEEDSSDEEGKDDEGPKKTEQEEAKESEQDDESISSVLFIWLAPL